MLRLSFSGATNQISSLISDLKEYDEPLIRTLRESYTYTTIEAAVSTADLISSTHIRLSYRRRLSQHGSNLLRIDYPPSCRFLLIVYIIDFRTRDEDFRQYLYCTLFCGLFVYRLCFICFMFGAFFNINSRSKRTRIYKGLLSLLYIPYTTVWALYRCLILSYRELCVSPEPFFIWWGNTGIKFSK